MADSRRQRPAARRAVLNPSHLLGEDDERACRYAKPEAFPFERSSEAVHAGGGRRQEEHHLTECSRVHVLGFSSELVDRRRSPRRRRDCDALTALTAMALAIGIIWWMLATLNAIR